MKSAGVTETIALIEVGGSHDECLLTQMYALKSRGCSIVMICTQEIRERNPQFENYIDEFYIVSFRGGKFRRYSEMRRSLKFMEKKGATHAVLNTAQGDLIRNLCIQALFSSIEFIGIIHTTRKLKGSFTQKVINRKVKKYFLLSEYLLSTVEAPRNTKLDYFYPIRFEGQEFEKEENQHLEITVIGGVENRRKDLDGFCEMIQGISEDVNFTFLGKSDPASEDVQQLEKRLEELNIRNRVQLFDSFVDQNEFLEQLQKTDVILPLIHPDTPSADQYFKNQIAGAMSVSFAFKIPMLLHNAYAHIEEMSPASFYYTQNKFVDALKSLETSLESKKTEMRQHQPYAVEFQEKRFAEFVLER